MLDTFYTFKNRKILLISILFVSSICFAVDLDEMLQTKKRDFKFQSLVSSLDLNSEDVRLEYKMGESSIGLKIYKNDDYEAYWYPNENFSANEEGQVVTYYLGRFLKMSELVTPSTYFYISGDSLLRFEELLLADTFTDTQTNPESDGGYSRLLGKRKILKKLREHIKNQTPYRGAIIKKMKKFLADDLVDWQNYNIKMDHPLVEFIRADQPMPSSKDVMELYYYDPEEGQQNTSTQIQLAKDLSKIMVLDMLTGQWDRFSGANLEARFDKGEEDPKIGRIRLLARDNGGAVMEDRGINKETGLSWSGLDSVEFTKYLAIVTRFDKKQIKRLRFLEEQLDSNAAGVKAALRMESDTALLTSRVKAVLEHVQTQIDLYGEEMAYFQK